MSADMMHTPEPWKVNVTPQSSNQNFVILDSGANGHSKRIAAIYSDRDEADARRIVACVNACAGIDTEMLEAGPYLDAVKMQRDELVSALRNITECAEAGADGANMDLWIEQARAALAKVSA